MIWRPTTLVIAAGAIFWKVEACKKEEEVGKEERIKEKRGKK
jgi:hypothetical protein